MKKYFLGYDKAAILGVCAVFVSVLAALYWHKIEELGNNDLRLIWENINLLIIGLCFMPSITVVWLTYADRNLNFLHISTTPVRLGSGEQLKSYIPIFITCAILYVLLASLMYGAWMQGDEFGKAWTSDKESLTNRISAAFGTYLAAISRNGDFLLALFPLPINRWPCYIITPFIVILIPLFIGRLMAQKAVWWTTRKGICFYIFAFFLLLLSVHVDDYWRNYRCHAAVVNYLWPSCASIFFLSLYNPANFSVKIRGPLSQAAVYVATFILGFYCAWGTECGTVIIAIVMITFYAWHIIKRQRVPAVCTIGTAGAMWGALLLLASPALRLRSSALGSFGKWHMLSSEELTSVVQNLNWDKIIEYNGGYFDSIIVLKSIPLFERIYFIPFLAERLWQSCQIPAIVACILFVIILLSRSILKRKQIFITSIVFLFLTLITTLSFLAGAIPTTMTFLTPSYIVAILACYMFIKIPDKGFAIPVITAFMAIGALVFFVPLGIEAWNFKKYERDYIAQIQQQKDEGKRDLIITYPIPQNAQQPKNSLKLIADIEILNESSERMSKVYAVDSIRFVYKNAPVKK